MKERGRETAEGVGRCKRGTLDGIGSPANLEAVSPIGAFGVILGAQSVTAECGEEAIVP